MPLDAATAVLRAGSEHLQGRLLMRCLLPRSDLRLRAWKPARRDSLGLAVLRPAQGLAVWRGRVPTLW